MQSVHRGTWARRATVMLTGIVLMLAGCDVAEHSAKVQVYQVKGKVESVVADQGQAIIDHGDIPGLMPGMTMNFDVPNPAVLAKMRAGQEIEFTLELRDRSFRIIDVTVLGDTGEAGAAGMSGSLGGEAPDEVAPAFALIDQDGAPVSLTDFEGKVVLLDFIYTHCPGPCPILTGIHASVQAGLDPSLRDRIRLVSISLDPERDTPEAMKAYAKARGADLDGWSFLTGEPEVVDEVVRSYAVGTGVQANGEIEHLVVSFLIDGEGRILKRYLGLEHTAETLRAALEREAA